MKKYVKPDVIVTEFELNEAVSACNPQDVYSQVPVDCLANGSHDIFYDACESNYSDCAIVITSNGSYLVWAGANLTPLPAGEYSYSGTIQNGVSGVNALVKAVTGSEPGKSGSGDANNYHAGLITPKITSVVNHS